MSLSPALSSEQVRLSPASPATMSGTCEELAPNLSSLSCPPNATDMSKVRDRGGKILVYHVVSDPIFSVNDTEAWYNGVEQTNGGDPSGFARFFRIPGMDHCRNGVATDQFDGISALVRWVEAGEAPEVILASARGADNPGGRNEDLPADWSPDRTRPLCPYPKVATYKGSGSIEEAGSFFRK
jgi:hypothetical protein